MTPTARTLAECRKRGWLAQVVEQTVPRTFIKRDLFGFVDVVALDGARTVAIQCTDGTSVAKRVAKMRGERAAELERVIAAGWHVEVWGWAKRGARGKRKMWTLREIVVAGNQGMGGK